MAYVRRLAYSHCKDGSSKWHVLYPFHTLLLTCSPLLLALYPCFLTLPMLIRLRRLRSLQHQEPWTQASQRAAAATEQHLLQYCRSSGLWALPKQQAQQTS
jgi:hypothetical protein